ncbi:MAG: aminopeptidase, partial [Verrucomicrobiae bacterium]|nr:aminopeptidase [Verrucomicrobiae bacterium]
MNTHEVERLAELVTSYSLAIEPGNVVVVSGPGVAEPLIHALFRSALSAGALPVIRFQGDLYRKTRLRTAGADQDRWLNLLNLPEGSPINHS